VQRTWRSHGLQPHRIRTFKLSSDPHFAAKVRDIVALYVDPPAHAVVLSIDEKSQIQALDRTQPGLPMKRGRAGTMTHDYKRNGTTTLFAALDVLDGKVLGRCMQRHRHQEFIRFLNTVEKTVPASKAMHVILDNYAAHKHPKVIAWLARHPRVTFHFTPTSASWLNAVEGFFATLTKRRLRRGTFLGVVDLQAAINRYLAQHNTDTRRCGRIDEVLTMQRRALARCEEAGDADGHERGRLGHRSDGVPVGAVAAGREGSERPQVPGSGALLHRSQHHLAGAAGRVRRLEHGLEAVLASVPGGRVRGHVRCARGHKPDRPPRADVRFHHGPSPRLRRWGQGGQDGQALGRSRGGFSTKIHLKTDFDGLPLAFDLTAGQASDSPRFPFLLDLGPEIAPRAAIGDKGYDSHANRAAARSRGICPVIPVKAIAKAKPTFFPRALYRGRARIEQTVGKLKRFKRVALRCEKTAQNYASFVALGLTFILVKSVHTT
jgi:transposase